MLLAIDVGNTNIVLGVFDGARLAESWRLATLRERTSDELGILVTHLFARSGIAIDHVSGRASPHAYDGGHGAAVLRPAAADG